MQWYLTVISICISLIINNDEYQKPSLVNYLLNLFFSNFFWLFVFLLISFLYILEPNPWSETYFVNIISQSVAFIFLKFPKIVEEQNNFFIL